MSNLTCPACSSTDVISYITLDEISDNFGNKVSFEIIENRCFTCDTFGDFGNQNNSDHKASLEYLNTLTVTRVIEIIREEYPNDTAVEQKLRLDYGTLQKWYLNPRSISREGLTLLKIIGKDLGILGRRL